MKRSPLRSAAALALLVVLAPEAGATSLLTRALNEQVAAARRVAPSLGVHVVDVESGDEVYAYNADRPQILASNTKLFTTAAALELLTPDYQFETPVLIRGATYDGILDGDLAVVGGGDPNISGRFHDGDSFYIFRRWAASLRQRGVREVSGDLYLVHGLFRDEKIHPEWPRDQLARWYEAPVAALSFNDNCVLVRVAPGAERGAPARVKLVPDLGLFRVVAQVSTTSSRRRQRITVKREPGSHQITVSGRVYRRGPAAEAWVTVPDPVEYFGAALRAALEEEGVRIYGRLRPVEELPGAVWERVTVYRSRLLPTLEVVNQRSQNFYAESVVKLLGARSSGEGSWQAGVGAVEGFMARLGLDGELSLADGSGMSRGNRATPRAVTQLLQHMFFHPWGREYLRSLPASGSSNGSWRRRLSAEPYRGNVFAKTGTLSGVSALSGYAKAVSGRVYAFAILCNDTRAVWRARQMQDRILEALIDEG